MKTKIAVLALMLSLSAPSVVFAQDIFIPDGNNNKVAVMDDLVKDLIKRTLYSVGTKVLDKYVNPNNYDYNYTDDSSGITINPTEIIEEQQTYTTDNGIIPGQEDEPMIPVS